MKSFPSSHYFNRARPFTESTIDSILPKSIDRLMKSANMRISAVAAVVIILCAGLTYLTQPGDEGGSVVGSPWANTMLDGNLPDERPDAVDDFYT